MDDSVADDRAGAFYISWMRPIKRSRVHYGDCPHCRNGNGQNGQHRTGSSNTKWICVTTVDEANARIDALKNMGFDVGVCAFCRKRHLVRFAEIKTS